MQCWENKRNSRLKSKTTKMDKDPRTKPGHWRNPKPPPSGFENRRSPLSELTQIDYIVCFLNYLYCATAQNEKETCF